MSLPENISTVLRLLLMEMPIADDRRRGKIGLGTLQGNRPVDISGCLGVSLHIPASLTMKNRFTLVTRAHPSRRTIFPVFDGDADCLKHRGGTRDERRD